MGYVFGTHQIKLKFDFADGFILKKVTFSLKLRSAIYNSTRCLTKS